MITHKLQTINRLFDRVGNREQGTGNSRQELTQTALEKYFCKRSNVHIQKVNGIPDAEISALQTGEIASGNKVSEVVAWLWSQHPELTAQEVEELMLAKVEAMTTAYCLC